MSTAIAVIGAGWGDEGKGLMVDALARLGFVVVRANGGAQAGHTVRRPDGTGHVFHHVGAGAFRGAATYLSRFFVHNPLLLGTELDDLSALGLTPEILADPQGQVTTPWDMMINQIAEEARGQARHGSCGLGVNETLRRGADASMRIAVADLWRPARLASLAERVRGDWVPARLSWLGLSPGPAWRDRLTSPGVMAAFLEAAARFSASVGLDDGSRAAAAARQGGLLFEGAQGLLLDQDHDFFPYVTPSKTGLANPSVLALEWGVDHLNAVYVTRAYATRHGAGPFPREAPGLAFADPTNVPNAWQGRLRFGELDLDLLAKTIGDDRPSAALSVEKTLAMTCLDQVEAGVSWWRDGRKISGAPKALAAAARIATGAAILATSHGPCREDVAVSTGRCYQAWAWGSGTGEAKDRAPRRQHRR